MTDEEPDPVDRIVEQWNDVHPRLDTEPMALIGRVHHLSRTIAAQVEDHFRGHGISRGDYDVLASLRRAGDPPQLTPGQLQRGLLLSSAGISGRLNRLERAELLRRLPDPHDGRGVVVELTADGIALVDRLVHEDMDRQARWLTELSKTDRRALDRALRRLQEAVVRPPREG